MPDTPPTGTVDAPEIAVRHDAVLRATDKANRASCGAGGRVLIVKRQLAITIDPHVLRAVQIDQWATGTTAKNLPGPVSRQHQNRRVVGRTNSAGI